MKFIIGLDIGTTACKAIALDDRGQVVASTQEYYGLSVPQQGWAEQHIEEI
jgi:xylulokinase